MPSIFTPSPPEIERKEPGIGGKPPVDRRPTAAEVVGTTSGKMSGADRASY